MQSSVIRQHAETWDSFKKTLIKVLKILNPKTIFEYGPGVSTVIMSAHPSVEIIDSVEHDGEWFERYRWQMPDNVNIMHQPVLQLYPEQRGRVDKYDLIFIDGREREKCLYAAKSRLNEGGVVVLHDAERATYKDMINSYKYRFYTDDFHTVTLTDNNVTAMRLEALYDS